MVMKFILLGTLLAYQVQAQGRSPFEGRGVTGGGHLCNGTLRVYPDHLDWDTTYNDCTGSRYDVIEHRTDFYVYRLKPKTKRCKFQVLVVRKPEPDMYGWQAIGFTTEAAWRKNDENNDLPCNGLY